MVSLRHSTQASGTNNPNKQVSVNVWNEEHDLTGPADEFLSFDASGNATSTDLAATTGAALVGRTHSGTVQSYIDDTPRRLSYANRTPITDAPSALAALAVLHESIVGYAGPQVGAITGGLGKPVVYVKDPSLSRSPLDSLGRALDVAAANSGAQIWWEGTGHIPLILSDWLELSGIDNLTWYVPGRNLEIQFPRLLGAVHLGGNSNVIWHGTRFKPTPGPLDPDVVGLDESPNRTIFSHRYDLGQGLAVMFNEFWRPAWHALDITRATTPAGGDPVCNATVMGNIFWNCIQAHLFGTNNSHLGPGDPDGEFTTDSSTRKLFATLYKNAYMYCLQRLPKALGNSLVDAANNYFLLAPYKNERSTSPAYNTDASAMIAQEGGWLRSRANLVRSAHALVDNKFAMELLAGYSTNTGYLSDEGTVAENGEVIETRNAGSITAIPYTDAPVTAIPASGTAREQWVADILSYAGARVDSAPEGAFVLVEGSARVPDGELVVLDDPTDRSRMLERVDPLREYAPAVINAESLLSPTSLSYTRTVGFTQGKTSLAAIGPTTLDLANIESPYFAVQGNGGVATLKHVIRTDGREFEPGSNLSIQGVTSAPIWVTTATSIAATATAATDTLTVTAHGETVSGSFTFQLSNSGGALPAPLEESTVYYGIYVDANNFKPALTYDDAIAGTAINITDAGTGTHTAIIGSFNLPNGRTIIINASAKISDFRLNPGNNRWSARGVFPLAGSAIWNPASLANGAQQSTTVTVTGAEAGDIAQVSMSVSLQGTRMWAEVTGADTVTVYQRNDTGGAIDVAQGTLRVTVAKG